jgi:hypothetical protein
MVAHAIREFSNRRSFELFVIRMADADVHEVLHPERAIVGKNLP